VLRSRAAASLKTYSHLAAARRVPSEYEIATSHLLHYVPRGGFEVRASMDDWYARHQRGSRLAGLDWSGFADPRRTTYASYVALQRDAEAYADGISRTIEESDYDRGLDPGWVDLLERVLPVARFATHGFQMLAAYVGQMAPTSRIVVAAAMQAADEVRRIHRIAYRMAQLRRVRPTFGDASRAEWEAAPAWQPMREAVERALVAFDWGEALVALNVCLKPAFDALVLVGLADSGRARGDPLLGALAASLLADSRWHRAWTRSVVAAAGSVHLATFSEWARHWQPLARAAVAAFEPLLGRATIDRAGAWCTEEIRVLGLEEA
jgi:hypothetical protein